MKKFISVMTVVALLVCGTVLNTSASDTSATTFIYEEKEIIVENSDLSYDEKKVVADYVAEVAPESDVSTCGILCIFGHKLTTSTVTEITHNAYSTTPKCLQSIYQVESCTRDSCDYIEKTLISSRRISTCHG